MEITKVKKRDGSIVDYDRSRIEKAIENACVATGAAVEPNVFSAITDDVDQVLDRLGLGTHATAGQRGIGPGDLEG